VIKEVLHQAMTSNAQRILFHEQHYLQSSFLNDDSQVSHIPLFLLRSAEQKA